MKTKVDIEQIRSQLPHGSLAKIAHNAHVSRQTVHFVLTGKSQNLKVLNAIADYLTEVQSAEERLSSLINK